MKESFLILGLPRSRTAWLSTFFTVGDVFCWHDLSAECDTPEQIVQRIQSTEAPYVGLSDSALVLWLDKFLKSSNGEPWLWVPHNIVFVRRDPRSASLSFAKVTGLDPDLCWHVFTLINDALDCWQQEIPFARAINFGDLSNEPVMKALWLSLFPEVEFPYHHFRKLRDLNIQVKPEILRTLATNQEGHFQGLVNQLIEA